MSELPTAAERYLRELERSLATLPPAERAEIVAEIRSHLLDRPEAARDPAAALGPAPEYAASFLQARMLSDALARGSSWALGRALVAGAGRLVWWYVVAVLALGHAYGALLVLLAALKPLFPQAIGLFVGRRQFILGAFSGEPPAGAHEVLGWTIVPVFLVAGGLVLWLSHLGLRALVRRRLEVLVRARAALGAGQSSLA